MDAGRQEGRKAGEVKEGPQGRVKKELQGDSLSSREDL